MSEFNNVMSFEEGIPDRIKAFNSTISLSNKHFKDGNHSLNWEFKKDSSLKFSIPIGFKPFLQNSENQARSCFSIWIYNENPIDDQLVFNFGRKEKIDCSFTFGLNFTGWRTAWVMFESDMQGTPHVDMDFMSISTPKSVEKGNIYIDQIVFCAPIDPRHPTRDNQVPFVNLEADKKANSHWLALYYFSKLKPKKIEKVDLDRFKPMFKTVEDRFSNYVIENVITTKEDMDKLKENYLSFNIVREDNNVKGNAVSVVHYYSIFPKENREELIKLSKSVDVRDYTDLMYDMANRYVNTKEVEYKNQIRKMFLNMLEHMHDQGWAEGSSFGTAHHLGYNLKGFYKAVFLMKDVLKEEGILDRTQKTVAWFTGVGRIFNEDSSVRGENMDVLNTLLHGMLASILLMEDNEEKVQYLKTFGSWVSECVKPAPGLLGPFKIDGSVYHHCNHYPAYAEGGLNGVTPVIYFLSGTDFKVSKEAHETLKKAILCMRIYCNKYEWLVSLSSRHPTGKWRLSLAPFKYMTLAGTPDGKESIDKEVAAAYLRLVDCEDDLSKMLIEKGITKEDAPQGDWVMNYACLTLHRRNQWLAGVRGHSRYLWANETYLKANLFGRYITHGNLQIMGKGDPISNEDSGFVQEGFDWNRWSGTTTVHLPIEELRSNVRNVDSFSGFEEMLISDESYAGGCNIEGKNGMFAMKLHEHPKYEGTHRARKSYFFFDNRIIALGSNIENKNEKYCTETTLFQNNLKDKQETLNVNGKKINDFPYYSEFLSENLWVIDNKDNGYYVPKGQKLCIQKTTQNSKAQNTGEDTQGDFASAYISHGKAPKNGEYEYAVLVDTNINEMQDFVSKVQDKGNEPYVVLQKDFNAHIVKDKDTGITAYVLFESSDNIDTGIVKAVTSPCMVMVKEKGDNVTLSLCDPDLRLYEGVEEDQYDENGNRKEVSVYSRKWKDNSSIPAHLQLTLKGSYDIEENEKVKVISRDNNKTIIDFVCCNAEVIEINLKK